jgi:hypothetical protein
MKFILLKLSTDLLSKKLFFLFFLFEELLDKPTWGI